MKKILLLLTAFMLSCCFAWAQLGVGQQIANNNFESWSNPDHTSLPTEWNSIINGKATLVTQLGQIETVSKNNDSPTGYGYSAQIKAGNKIAGVIPTGSISTGKFNLGSITADNTKNCAYTNKNNSRYNQTFTAYPDSLYVYVKTHFSNSTSAKLNVIIHNDVLSTGASDNAVCQDPNPTSQSNSIVNTDGNGNRNKFVAVASKEYNTGEQWVQQKIAFDYNYPSDNPKFILATFSTNKDAGGGSAGDYVRIDDIILIYNTRLASLKANNIAISGFNPNVTTYTYPLCEGAAFPTITFTCQSSHATATITHNPSSAEPYTTIRVNHRNQENVQGVYKDYTINYQITHVAAPSVASSVNKCYGTPVQINATIPEGCTGYWSTGDPSSPQSTGSSYLYNGNENTTINVLSHHNVAGCNSSVSSVSINVYPQIAAPTPAATTSICSGSTATFSASLPTGENLQLRWYETATSTTVLGTESSIEVANLTATTTRYASTYNTITGCESGRVAVTVNVNAIPAVPTAAATTSVCYGATATFSATLPTGANLVCHWYETATSTDLLSSETSLEVANLTANTTRYVSTYNTTTGCESGRVAVTVNVSALPSAPSVNNTAICGAGEATLSVQAVSGESYLWFENATGGESIHNDNSWTCHITENTTLYVEAVSAEGCHSTSRTAATATVKSVPTAPSASDASRCGTGNLTLSVNGVQDGYTYNWYLNNELVNTGINYTIENLSVTTTYNVTATLDGCESEASSVTATINTIPSAPTVGNAEICGGGEVTLTVTPTDENSYEWYANSTGGESLFTGTSWTGTISADTSFHVEAISAEGCHSTTRTAVTATVNAIPAAPSAQNLNLCGVGTAVISAVPAENCICKWFNSDYEAISTGISQDSRTLTVNNLSVSSIYYVKSYQEVSHCESDYTSVTVTVSPVPGRPAVAGSFTRCGEGELSLTATPGSDANSLHWYNGSTFLAEGTAYNTGVLSTSTNYTVKSYNTESGCEGTSFITVSAIVNPIPTEPQISSNPKICGSGTSTLTAQPGSNANICRWILGEDTSSNNTFTTPELTETTSVNVQSYNSTTKCASNNVSVTVTVNALPATAITTSDAQCLGSVVTLGVSNRTQNIACRWYASEESTTILFTGTEYHPANLVEGENHFYVEMYDSLTSCISSQRALATATMTAVPAEPMIKDTVHCGPASFTLNILNANTEAYNYHWYDVAEGGEELAQGSSYTTNELSETAHFYVSASPKGFDCESPRHDVTVTINAIPATPEVSGTTVLCAGQSTSLTATSDAQATGFQWFNNEELVSEDATFNTPALNENITYSVKAINGTSLCESAKLSVAITVNANPAAPVVSNDTTCQYETVTLRGEATSGNTCYWYAEAQATEHIATGNTYSPTDLASGTSTFYVNQKNDETNCQSERIPVYAHIYPTYNENMPIVACDSFVWNNETFRTSGNYERNWGSIHGCDSVVTLQLTINHSKTTHIDTTVCDLFVWNDQPYTESAELSEHFSTQEGCDSLVNINLTVLKKTVGADHIYLCSNEIPYNYHDFYTVNAAGTFTVHTLNAAGCDSTITLTVTVNPQPSPASITSAARCGEGSVALSANAGTNGTTCHWYATATSEEVVFEGTSYNTPNISESTTYYVSSYNNYSGHPCESGRLPITATINPIPANPIVEAQVRCGDGTVEFTAVVDDEASTTCRWYLLSTASNPSQTALTYSPTVYANNGTTSFYVESYIEATGCKSSREEVTATAYAIPATPSLAAMDNCGATQFHIDAPATGFYKWYDNATSTVALDITNNTTPTISESRSYFISLNQDYESIVCESPKAELILTIYPVYEAQMLFDTLCQGDTYSQHGIQETFNDAGSFDRTLNTISSHGCDSLVTLRLYVKENRSSEFSETACDSYTWNEETFTQSDNIVRHFTSSIGCDSVVTLHLTINKSKNTEFNITECDSYTWNTTTYTESGNYEQHFSTSMGCDSTVTLHLTINKSKNTEFSITECDSYTWNTTTYTESGNYEQHFSTSMGCDSTVTLHLTINHSSAVTLYDQVCAANRYQANGFDTVFNIAGNYTLVNSNLNLSGCDSTTTLHLTVNPIYNKAVVMTICESALPFTWNDITYPAGTESGNYEHTYYGTTTALCDSIVTLYLTISNQYITNLNEDICQGEHYTFGGKTLTESGIYYDTLKAANLCDSIVILSLNVHQLNTTTLYDEICFGESYTQYGFNITPTETGDKQYERVVQTQFGCDSTIILNLSIHPTYYFENEDHICENMEYVWEGHDVEIGVREAGTYTIWDSLSTQTFGCDSVYKLTLTVNPTFYFEEDAATCDNAEYVWQGHAVEIGILEAGRYTIWDSLSTQTFGCDSVYKLTLTVNPTFYSEEEATTCDNAEYVWQGHEHIQIGMLNEGTYTVWDSTTTINGCDSVYKLTLTVHSSFYQHEEASICDNEDYVWEGHEHIEIGRHTAGIYTIWDSTTTVNGCDSVYELTLTVNPTFYQENADVNCDNVEYVWQGHEHIQIGLLEMGTYTIWDSTTTVNGCDSVYKLTLTVNPTKHSDIEAAICEGEVYVYNNTRYSTTGNYDHTFETTSGCDSVVTLHLTVNPTYNIDTTIYICEGLLPYNFADTIFYQSGRKDVYLHTENGCDSTIHVTLNVTPFIANTLTATICENELPYRLKDSVFYAAGVYEVTETHEDGCNEITTLTLIVNPTHEQDDYATACGSYTLVRPTYSRIISQSGIYTDTLSTIEGCDSIIHLHLTIYPTYYYEEEGMTCDNEAYVWTGHEVEISLLEEGTYTIWDSLTTINGCDSIYRLTLTVNPTFYQESEDEVCENNEYVWEGHEHIQIGMLKEGTYTIWDSLKTANGCDSVYELTLTVYPTFNQEEIDIICANEAYVWGGHEHIQIGQLEAGEYTFWDSLTTINGCDSVYKLSLTVNPTFYQENEATTCDNVEFVWEGHEHIQIGVREEGRYTIWDSLTTINNCDSVYKLSLTVKPTFDIRFDTTVCDVFVWNDSAYTSSNVITRMFETSNGCDSAVTINLTVNSSYDISIDTTVCDLFTWDGDDYTESGVFTHGYHSVQGCDSVVTVNLTVHHSVEQNETLTICQSELPYPWRDTTFEVGTVSGEYTFVRETVFGCDSIVNLNLTVNPNNEYYENPINLCQGETYTWNGQVISESGLYTDTVDNQYGCYDVYKLEVSVHPTYLLFEYDTVCSNELPITWRNQTINNNGQNLITSEITYPTQYGCDSTYQLFLTVNSTFYQENEADVCDNEEYVWENHEIEIGIREAGIYTIWDSLYTQSGCDSVYKLTLHVHPTYYDDEEAETCDNVEFVWAGHDVEIGMLEVGTYTIWDSLFTESGCDSVYQLTLTVHPSFYQEDEAVTCDNEAYVWEGHNVQIGQLPANNYIFWDSLFTVNGCDSVYKLSLTVNPTAHSIETASACSNEDSYIWHGMTITESGIYFDTLATMLACDSVCELRFTLLEPTSATFVDTTCANSTYTYYGFNIEHLTVGDTTLQRVIENSVGCDSTITVSLNVKPFFETTFDTINCGALLWNNTWYQESGQYQQVFEATNGCDSIVTMNLIVDTPSRDTVYVAACDLYEWDGTIYNQSGSYSKIYPQPVGCDSIAVLLLTINNSKEVTYYDTTCQGEIYQGYGFDTLITQVGNIQIQRVENTVTGCDSIINVMLRVHASYLTIDSVTTCDNHPYSWQGDSYAITGTYTKTYSSVHGCDSTFILVLKVNPSYNVDVEDTAYVGVPYHNHGLNFTPQAPGTQHISVPNVSVSGCDSIVNVTLVIVDNTGIQQQVVSKSIKLYPNPADREFTIFSTAENIREITVFDNNGKAVLHQSINGTTGKVNVEHLAAGFYFVRMQTDSGIVHKELIVQ